MRKESLILRDALPEEEIEKKSFLIKERLFSLREYEESRVIMFYVSTRSEVRTEVMIKQALRENKRVIVPITQWKEKKLLLSELKDYDRELGPGTFNILEPKKEFSRPVEPEEIDSVIVPGVAFDEERNRLGYGGGFYDNFLSKRGQQKRGQAAFLNCVSIGLAFEAQIAEEVPVGSEDVKVDFIVTENRLIKRS